MKISSLNLRNVAATAVVFLASTAALAADAGSPEASIGEALLKVLQLLAIAGAAYVSIALAGVGWGVGVKFIKRMRGAA